MAQSLWQIIKADGLLQCREEVNRENRLAIRLLAMVGLPLAAANMIVQMTLSSEVDLQQFFLRTSWVVVYFLVLLVVERWIIPDDYPYATALLYAVETPVIIGSILLGSFWDPDHQAITFFIFLMAMPMFVLDRPIRVMLVMAGWVALFLLACFIVKTPAIFERDLLHTFEFFLAALAAANVVIQVRMVALMRLEQVHNLETDLHEYETNQLTDLPSMSHFVARADDMLTTIVKLDFSPAIGFITLPQIKSFNSEFGYVQGDELIRRTADLLRAAFPDRLLCNITGSQFSVLCYESEIDDAMRAVNAGLKGFKEGYTVVCKAGFAQYVEGESSISLLDKARVAERSIQGGTDLFYRLYDEQLDADIKFREHIVAHVDEAIEQDYLEVYYQPIIRTSTGEVCNEEALSRWNDPIHGLLAPFRFIPPLEESRQVYKLTLHVVRRVLADLEYKRGLGMMLVPVSVNLSRYDFEQCDIVQEITNLVDASGFSHDMLRIEITESAFTEKQELLKREVARFRQNGFEVWMDDFGSEYSTLNLLQDLDFDLIKLDMQFMRSSSESGKNLIIVSSVINMANQMGVATLVEGVENEEHLGILRAMGCDKMQGFLFSKPLPLQNVISMVEDGSALPFEDWDERRRCFGR